MLGKTDYQCLTYKVFSRLMTKQQCSFCSSVYKHIKLKLAAQGNGHGRCETASYCIVSSCGADDVHQRRMKATSIYIIPRPNCICIMAFIHLLQSTSTVAVTLQRSHALCGFSIKNVCQKWSAVCHCPRRSVVLSNPSCLSEDSVMSDSASCNRVKCTPANSC